MYIQHLFLYFMFLLASFQNLSATGITNNCPTISILEENGPTCTSLGSVILSFTNVNDGLYNIDYDGGTFENIEILNNQATLHFVEAGSYARLSVTVSDCTSSENPSISISPINSSILSLNAITHPTSCDELGQVDFDVNGYPGEIYQLDYSWRESGEPSGGPDFRIVSNIPAGNHCIIATGNCHFFSDTLFVAIAPSGCEVWPGDANHSGQVDYLDALSIILKNGKSGPTRPNATTEWTPQLATNWNDNIPDGIDAKHADSNGDGIIHPNPDILAVLQNYGEVVPHQPNPSNNFSLTQNYVLVAERSQIQNFGGTNQVTFDLKLKNETNQILTIAGLGFSMTYTNAINPYFESINSELGTSGQNLFTFSKTIPNSRIDGAIGRTDRQNITVAPSSSILITQFIIDENIVTIDQDNPANNAIFVDLNGVVLQDNQGDQHYIGGSTATSYAGNQDNSNNLLEPLSAALLATHALDCPDGATAVIMPEGGLPPYQFLWDNGQHTASVNALNPGIYYVTLSDSRVEQVEVLIKIEGTINCATTLPIQSLDFEAIPQATHILLQWTNHQTNYQKMELERSEDGITFYTIGQQTALKQINKTFKFEDDNIEMNQTYYYRLKIRKNEQVSFSKIIQANATNLFSGIRFFPNPIQDKLTINIESSSSSPSEVIVFDAYGQEQLRLLFQDAPQFILDFTAFSSGLYFITVIQHGKAASFKVLKQ